MPSVYVGKGEYRHYEEFCNEDVIEYLSSELNTVTQRFNVISKSVFCKAVLAKFDEVSFIINAAGTCVEIAFAKAEIEKMTSVIEAIKKWEKFSKSYKPFCVKVDKGSSRSLLFESGFQTRKGYRAYFSKYELEITEI